MRFDHHFALPVDESPFAGFFVTDPHRRESFGESADLVELWSDHHLALFVDVSPFGGSALTAANPSENDSA